MTYIDGSWGEKAKERSKRRKEYFKKYRQNKPQYKGFRKSSFYQGEVLALEILKGSKRIYRPCDLSWRGKFVDVKTSLPIKDNTKRNYRWKFSISRQNDVADFFLLICKNFHGSVAEIYLVPNKGINTKTITFTAEGAKKYSEYLLSL